MKAAEQVYKKNQIKILNAQAEEKRRQQQLAKVQEAKEKGTYEAPGEPEDNQMSWNRGSGIQAAKDARA